MPEAALLRQLERVHALHQQRQQAHIKRPLAALTRWQIARLSTTYADLIANPRYRPATKFFLSDIYGAHDFSRRDADLTRIYPMLVRFMPTKVIDTIARSVEVNALTQALDLQMLKFLAEATDTISEAQYSEAYKLCDNRAERSYQIELIVRVGHDLDAVVHKPLVYSTLKFMRGPAHLAGLGELQDFLERGIDAFRHMNGASDFLRIIEEREKHIHEQILSAG